MVLSPILLQTEVVAAGDDDDDDGRMALDAALDALPFLCPPVHRG